MYALRVTKKKKKGSYKKVCYKKGSYKKKVYNRNISTMCTVYSVYRERYTPKF